MCRNHGATMSRRARRGQVGVQLVDGWQGRQLVRRRWTRQGATSVQVGGVYRVSRRIGAGRGRRGVALLVHSDTSQGRNQLVFRERIGRSMHGEQENRAERVGGRRYMDLRGLRAAKSRGHSQPSKGCEDLKTDGANVSHVTGS